MSEMAKKTTSPRKTSAKKAVPTADARQVRATDCEIAQLAYQLWLNRGKQHGNDTQDWLRAEEQLNNR